MSNEIVVGVSCRCGWLGLALSTEAVIEIWYEHSFSARGGFHERTPPFSTVNGTMFTHSDVDRLLERVTGLNQLGRFRKNADVRATAYLRQPARVAPAPTPEPAKRSLRRFFEGRW